MKLKAINKHCKKLSHQYGIIHPPSVIPMPYSRIGKRAALGYYYNEDNIVAINKYVLEQWGSKQILETLKHELAHALCYQNFGHGGHDKDFKEICKILNFPNNISAAVKKDD